MANLMMASHGRGQRFGQNKIQGLGWAIVALGLGGLPGSAQACHLHHHKTTGTTGTTTTTTTTTPSVAAAEILNPTSMVPQTPPLTPSTAPLPTVMPTSTAAPQTLLAEAPAPANAIMPTALTNPPAAEGSSVPSAPPAVSAYGSGSATPMAATAAPMSCPPPPCAPPIPANPPAGEGLTGTPTLPPSASGSISATPEPSTIVSALVMLGAAVAYRRRNRVVS